MISKLKRLLIMPWELLNLAKSTYLMILSYMPGEIGFRLRRFYWKKKLRYLGKNVLIDIGVYFQNPEFISIDDNCWLDKYVSILAGLDDSTREKILLKNKDYKGEPGVVHFGKNIHVAPGCIISGIGAGVYISDDCGFSSNCKLYAFSHHYRSRLNPGDATIHFGPMAAENRQCLIEGPIYIGANTGIALNSVILPGVSILQNCFVTINSVVHYGRYKNNSIISGNPANISDIRFKLNE